MAGYRQNLSDIYTGITEGKYHASDKKLSDMYREVICESNDEVSEGGVCKRCHGTGTEPQEGWDGLRRNRLVKEWMSQCDFNKPEVMMSIVGYIEALNINWDLVHEFVKSEKPSLEALIIPMTNPENSGIKTSIVDIIVDRFEIDSKAAEQLYYSLFNLPFAESTVSVGKGELVLALFTDAKKGQVGDIEIAGFKASDDEESVPVKGKRTGLDSGSIQIEVKVGKARVISARNGKFLDPNIDIERAFAARKQEDGEIKAVGTGKFTKRDGFDRTLGHSGFYDDIGTALTNKEFVGYLFGKETAPNPGFETFSRVKNGCAEQMLEALNRLDPRGGIDSTPNYLLRENAISAALVWSYANPSGSGHGFNYLLLILSSGLAENEWKTLDKKPRSFPGTDEDYANLETRSKVDDTGKEYQYKYFPGAMVKGDKDHGLAIQCKGPGAYSNILELILSGHLIVSRLNEKSGRLDGEGIYMYYRGSNTNVDHEPGVGVSLF